jgi:alkylhydroperoxidase family enzyme
VESVFEDWRTADVRPELRAALGFIEELTLRPTEVSAETVKPLKNADLSDKDIEEVAIICSLFNVIVRLADTLEFEVPSEADFNRLAPSMLTRGYA